jgi:hypothetical protein
MSNLNQSAPAAQEPKSADFVKLEPFPESGPAILTVTAYNYIPNYTKVNDDGSTDTFNALEFYLGTVTAAGPRFIKTWPSRYSIHEKSSYSKIYRAATGHLPQAGSSPKDIIGKGVQTTIENLDKVSKKGTKYTASRAKDLGPVFPKLRDEIVPLEKLLPALTAILEAPKDGKPATKADDDGSAPF